MKSPATSSATPPATSPNLTPRRIMGTGVVPGIAYAPAAWKQGRPDSLPTATSLPEAARRAEADRLQAAVAAVSARLDEHASQATGVATEVLAATAALARDTAWRRGATKLIETGAPATEATVTAIGEFIAAFEKRGGVVAERGTDLRDIRDRVVAQLLGLPEPGVPTPDSPVVLLADDLAPADTAGLDPDLIVALITELGGPTSHTAIIARQLGIPCIVAAPGIHEIADGTPLLVDGAVGSISTTTTAAAAEAVIRSDRRRRDQIRSWQGPGRTLDGREIELLANVQDGNGARTAARSQARGVGLLRTELSFFNADHEPTLEEQIEAYGQVLDAFPGRKVVVRTLDAGSDKPLKFLTMTREDNPALGVRGIRLAVGNDALLTRQLDAIAAAAQARPDSTVWVMAPMVAAVPEAKEFAAHCRDRGLVPGIMVEVPSAALLAPAFLEHVDFVSVGTNDLSQYTMAADRMSPRLATLTDPWQPAVLTLVSLTAAAGQAAGKPVGVCGEAAADPLLACVLVGLGITSLSMATNAIAGVGVQLGTVSFEQCQAAASAVLATTDAGEARETAARVLN